MSRVGASAVRAAVLLSLLVVAAHAGTIYVDTTDAITTTGWNSVSFRTAGMSGSLVDSTGAYSTVSMQVIRPLFGTANNDGTATPTGAAAEFAPAGVSQAYGFSGVWQTGTDITQAVAVVNGLVPGDSYTFTFYASRMSATDNRETLYIVEGATSGSATLNAANNASAVAVVPDVVADAAGRVTITVRKGENNVNVNGFFYILAMKIAGTIMPGTPPVPPSWPQPTAPVYLNLYGSGSGVPLRTNIGTALTSYDHLINSNGVATALSVSLTDNFQAGRTGTITPTGDAAEFGNMIASMLFGQSSNPTAAFRVHGTAADHLYTFTFLSCREGQTNNRETRFVTRGATTVTNLLNASSNYSQVTVTEPIAPDVNGEFTITVTKGPNNNDASGYFYLNAAKIQATRIIPPPNPCTAILIF